MSRPEQGAWFDDTAEDVVFIQKVAAAIVGKDLDSPEVEQIVAELVEDYIDFPSIQAELELSAISEAIDKAGGSALGETA